MRKYWTYEKCKEEALKYETKSEFKKRYSGAYKAAKRNKWLNEICSHMILKHKPNNYWTKEKCKEVALLCTSRSEFQKRYGSAYSISSKNGWIDKICKHMKPIGNYIKRLIYVFEFPDKSVYVGLTYNSNKRYNDHITHTKSSVYKYIQQTGLQPEYKLLTQYVDVELAIKLENKFLKKYERNGWKILNITKTGSIGNGIIKWTKEECIKEGRKYKSKVDFQKNNGSAYAATRKNGWLIEICSHMEEFKKPNGYWTLERCKEEALKYSTRNEFRNNSSTAYSVSCKNNWLNEICYHMEEYIRLYWNFENCKKEALKYQKKIEFKRNAVSAYGSALNYGWLNQICSHMVEGKKPNGYWTYERCLEKSKKYRNKEQFKKSCGAYGASRKNNWLNEFFPKK